MRFQVLFHSPLGVLFTFPSRYLFTIGHRGVFSLGRWSSQIPAGFHVSCGTRVPLGRHIIFAYRAVTFYGRPSQTVRLAKHFVTLFRNWGPERMVPRLLDSNAPRLALTRFRLFPVRSPLLGESLLISVPPGTEMFHFPGLSSPTYEFSERFMTSRP